jgi:hypothetical protein
MNRDEENKVFCPKSNSFIPNISNNLDYIEPIVLPYFKR